MISQYLYKCIQMYGLKSCKRKYSSKRIKFPKIPSELLVIMMIKNEVLCTKSCVVESGICIHICN